MKSLVIVILLSATAWAGPVSLKVEVLGDKDTETQGKATKTQTPARVTTDTRQLEISLSNTSAQPLPNLTVVYYLFAKDVKEKEIVLSKKGEKSVSLAPQGRTSFTTEKAVIVYHSRASKTKGGKIATTPATGAKMAGYGVQVMNGDEVLAEIFDPRELKANKDLAETSTLYDDKKWKKKKAN